MSFCWLWSHVHCIFVTHTPIVLRQRCCDPSRTNTDQFNTAVDAWNGGAVDNFSLASGNDWTYSLSNTCGNGSNAIPLSQNSMLEDLKSESREGGTFSSYPRLTYFESATPDVQINTGSCALTYEFFHQNASVMHPSSFSWNYTDQSPDLCALLVRGLHPKRSDVVVAGGPGTDQYDQTKDLFRHVHTL